MAALTSDFSSIWDCSFARYPNAGRRSKSDEGIKVHARTEGVHRQRFESLAHANQTIGIWIQFYNHKRPHQALAMRTPNEAFKLVA
ncbi:MAG: integrase core domain-containing protein [Hyphomicrobiales bacterium]